MTARLPKTAIESHNPRSKEPGLTATDQRTIAGIDHEAKVGLELYSWLQKAWMSTVGGISSYELLPSSRGRSVWGFRAEPELPSLGRIPIIGAIQDNPFDCPKTRPDHRIRAAEWIRGQAQAFVLNQFLKIATFDRSQPYPLLGHPSLPPFLELFSWCPAKGVIPAGIRFSAKYFKQRDGRVGRFPAKTQLDFPPLGNLGEQYRWLVLEADPLEQYFTLRFASEGGPALRFPIRRPLRLLLTPEMVVNEESSESGYSAFGFGLTLLGSQPQTWSDSPPALYLLSLIVNEVGDVVARTIFVSQRPDYPPGFPGYDPIQSTLWLPDLLSSKRRYNIPSRQRLDSEFLTIRMSYLYNLSLQLLPIWNWVPDWRNVTDAELLYCLDSCQPARLPQSEF